MKKSVFLAVLPTFAWILIAVLSFTGATYAWFHFSVDTHVNPISGTISRAGDTLKISTTLEGEFGLTCELAQSSGTAGLRPYSTTDLTHFYKANLQDGDGITYTYLNADTEAMQHIVHGVVYLRSEDIANSVYLYAPMMNFGENSQDIAAARLALRVSTAENAQTFIFKLDSFANASQVSAVNTIEGNNVVVANIASDGKPVYAADPSQDIAPYLATGNRDDIREATNALCQLGVDETATIEYWLYLEGCDINCINNARNTQMALQLGFAGFPIEEEQ